MRAFLKELLSFSVLLPAALMCLFPVLHQLRFRIRFVLLRIAIVFLIAVPPAAWLCMRFPAYELPVSSALVLVLFLVYALCLTAPIYKTTAVFLYVCAWMAIFSNLSSGFDALFNPRQGAAITSWEGILFQFGISSIAVCLLYYPVNRYGTRLIDKVNIPSVWWMLTGLSALFVTASLVMRPVHYSTLYIRSLFSLYWFALAAMAAILVLFTGLFYYMMSGMLTYFQVADRNRLLEMQERQYLRQQQYIRDSARARHDFKQNVRTMAALSRAKDYDALDAYLEKYMASMPENDVTAYCKNNAVNALLNYYAQTGADNLITLNWTIDLPEYVNVSDVDLCSMLGNILENAVAACQEIPPEKRWIQLTVTTMNDTQLCIVSTNSFSGRVRQREGRYLSTRRMSDGIGLTSIASTAEKYGGVADFSHDETNFFSNIMIPLEKE